MGNKVVAESFLDLNAKLNLWTDDHKINFEADLEAARQYHLTEVNTKYVYFPSLEDKLDYLFVNGYYEKEVWDRYSVSDTKELYKYAYSFKHRFTSFLGALKFYQSYALKTFDGETWLERFEDRVVACALELAAGDVELAKDMIREIITGRLQPATPTFSNCGKKQRGERVSCFLLDIQDSMNSIGRAVNSGLQLSKRGGGVGFNISNIREFGAPIKGFANMASGVLPVCKLFDDAFSYANQLGSRQGACAVYISVHHPDVMRVLDAKKENADEKSRLKTLSVGLVVTDKAYELAKNNEELYQFSPYDVERVYGMPFSKVDITTEYENMVNNSAIKKTKIKARQLFQIIAEIQFESGYPYILNIDTVNRANAVHGTVDMSNLCVTGDTEVLTDSGYKRVIDLYNSGEDFKAVIDNRTYDMKARTAGTSLEAAVPMQLTAKQAEVFKVSTRDGLEIKATAWHKFYVRRGERVEKLALNELSVGDKLLVQSGKGHFGSIHEPDLAYVAGILAGDGTFGQTYNGTYSPRLDLYADKQEFIPAVTASVHRILSTIAEKDIHHSSTNTPEFVKSASADRYSLCSVLLGRVLAENGVTKESKTSVPEFVKRGNEATVVSYLNGIYQTDSCVSGNKKAKTCGIELASIDIDFLKDVQKLLLNLGIFGKIYSQRKTHELTLLPDGKGGMKEYSVKPTWTLRVSHKEDLRALRSIIVLRSYSAAKFEEFDGTRTGTTGPRRWCDTAITSIEFAGIEDVYDTTVENTHSLIFNGLVTGNCSEIVQVSTPSELNEDLSYAVEGRDISCNLASLNVKYAMDGGNLAKTVETSIRLLTEVSDISKIESVPSVRNGNDKSHSVGLGQFGLHQFFLEQGLQYGDENSLDFTNIYFMTIAFHALRASNKIAVERGKSFFEFEKSKYADPQYLIQKYIPESMRVPNENTAAIFAKFGIEIPELSDWEDLAVRIAEGGLYNAYTQAVPPTGSISYINGGTASIHPAVAAVEIRKEGQTGRVAFATPGLTNDNFGEFKDAYELGYKVVIDIYAEAQKHVDQAMSLTLFYKNTDTTRTLNQAYIYAWRKGIKSLYYCRVRSDTLEGTDVDSCVSCTL